MVGAGEVFGALSVLDRKEYYCVLIYYSSLQIDRPELTNAHMSAFV